MAAFVGRPSYLGMELLWLRRRLARGDWTHNSADDPLGTPIAISDVLARPSTAGRTLEAPAWSPCAGLFTSDGTTRRWPCCCCLARPNFTPQPKRAGALRSVLPAAGFPLPHSSRE